jgi:meiotic recombination protein SPO11
MSSNDEIVLQVKDMTRTGAKAQKVEFNQDDSLILIKKKMAELFDLDPNKFDIFHSGRLLSTENPLIDLRSNDILEIKTRINATQVQKLRGALHLPSELEFPAGVHLVKNTPQDTVKVLIFEEATQFLTSATENPETAGFRIPSRSSDNVGYDHHTKMVLLGRNRVERNFRHLTSVVSTAQMSRLMSLVYEQLERGIHSTKRDVFYQDVNLFKDQRVSDGLIEDLGAMIGVTRNSLNVVAKAKGQVIGRISFREDGDFIDCTKIGHGKSITPMIDKISNIESDAEFILVIEKDAAFLRLAEDRFYNMIPCICITASGQPDLATRMFVKLLRKELELPIFGLMDADPYGLDILRVYTIGSKAMSFETAELSVSDIHWLGLLPSDLDNYQLPDSCRIPMDKTDQKRAEDMLKEDFVQARPRWVEEINLMIKNKQKAEIQALASRDPQFMTNQYLPQKLNTGDWV